MMNKRPSPRNNPAQPAKKRRPADHDGDLDQPSQHSGLTISDESTVHSSAPSPPSISSVCETVSSSGETPQWESIAPFQPTQLFTSTLPIFRKSDVRQYEVVEERSDEELARYTFTQTLD
jgi:hypothetical protein